MKSKKERNETERSKSVLHIWNSCLDFHMRLAICLGMAESTNTTVSDADADADRGSPACRSEIRQVYAFCGEHPSLKYRIN